jgi:hypothetical protein
MKFLILLAVIALSTTQALARTRVLRAADHEGMPHDEAAPAATHDMPAEHHDGPAGDHAQKPAPAVLLEKALRLLAAHGDEQTKKDVEEFQSNLKDGNFKGIMDKVKMGLQGQEVTVEALLKSIQENSAGTEYSELITRVGKAGKEQLEKLHAKHDARATKIEEGIASVVKAIDTAINPA